MVRQDFVPDLDAQFSWQLWKFQEGLPGELGLNLSGDQFASVSK
jgi:hypothetical protein